MSYARHYCYRIDFEDGFVYFGVRSCYCDPTEDTSYWGSPVTYAAKWLTDTPRSKTIVSEHETRELAEIAEDKLILAFWAVSKELSLNASIRGTKFHVLGTKLYTDGAISIRLKRGGDVPEGFAPGVSDETRAKISEASAGKPRPQRTAEHSAKIAAANIGKPLTIEHRAKISEANTGKQLTTRHRAKISEANTGKKRTETQRAKLSEAVTGYSWYTDGVSSVQLRPNDAVPKGFKPGRTVKQASAAARARMSAAATGKQRGAEHCARISASKWYTDGSTSIRLGPDADVPEGFKPGRAKRSAM